MPPGPGLARFQEAVMASARGPVLILAGVLAFGASSTAVVDVAAAHAAPPTTRAVSATQRLATLERSHDVFAQPSTHATRHAAVRPQRPIAGGPTVLPVLRTTTGRDRREWLDVMLPGRPNGSTGWILARSTTPGATPWRVLVATSSRRVSVFRRGRLTRTFRAVVGKASTPTPLGRYFVEESIRLGAEKVGAPFALALSARSNVLQQYDGGPGQIALHGLGNVGGVLGTAVSHGCVRLDAASIGWLAAHIGPGTPVTIAS
jgi:lipoprotein-anchoring transpeptidase ErfK/SrfK